MNMIKWHWWRQLICIKVYIFPQNERVCVVLNYIPSSTALFEFTTHWVCLHGLESRSERRFKTWFGPFLILAHVNAKLFQIRLLKRDKKGVLDRDPPWKPDSRPCERKAVSEHDSCVCIFKMRAEAIHKRMGQSARTDCVVGAKYHSQCADPDRDWKGVCSPCERT